MRDLIWTVIVLWIVWKVYNAFAHKPSKQKSSSQNTSYRKEGEVKIETNQHQGNRYNPNNAEYVEFEEIK